MRKPLFSFSGTGQLLLFFRKTRNRLILGLLRKLFPSVRQYTVLSPSGDIRLQLLTTSAHLLFFDQVQGMMMMSSGEFAGQQNLSCLNPLYCHESIEQPQPKSPVAKPLNGHVHSAASNMPD